MNSKIGFIIGILFLAFIGVFMVKHKSSQKFTIPRVLGVSTESSKSFIDTSFAVIQTQASHTAQLVSNVVINAAMDPIIKHLDKLPPAQKEEVIHAVCK